ncbi:MAG TPA: hypothetical protein VFL57_12660 [Bryobacteraceae bacterium]|nr:hypothetical protein [Bryobacteraceae bacterium]
MALLNKLPPVAGMMAMRRFGPRYGPAGLLRGSGRRTLAGLLAGYPTKTAVDKTIHSGRTRRAY